MLFDARTGVNSGDRSGIAGKGNWTSHTLKDLPGA